MFKEFYKDLKVQIEDIKKRGLKYQIPNILTASRAIAPLFIIPAMICNKLTLAIIFIIIFALTDFIDGRIARKYNCVSEFGIKLDAICDKIFVLGIAFPLLLKSKELIIILSLELIISIVNLISESKGNKARTIISGKIKTGILSITLIMSYMKKLNFLFKILSIITIISQIIVLIQYILIDRKKDKESKKTKK